MLLFFSLLYRANQVACAFIHWFTPIASAPDKITGLWIVESEQLDDSSPSLAVVPLNSIVQEVHLILEYGNTLILEDFEHSQSFDVFYSFYVNQYSDHHMFDLLK